MNLIDILQPQANKAAQQAAQSAIDTATQKPFRVILSVDDQTKIWLSVLVVVGGIFLVRKR